MPLNDKNNVSAHELVSNDFSSETIGPIVTKFHMKPPWVGGMKSFSNGPGHMIKMSAMPVYGKSVKGHSDFKVKTCFAETVW